MHREACRKYKQEKGNSPFLRTRTHASRGSFLFQSPQNSRLKFVGEQNARASMKGEQHEQATPHQYNRLWQLPKIARRISARFGNLERAPCRDLSVSLDRKGSSRRTAAIASEVRSNLHGVAEPHTQLLSLSVGVKNRRT